MNSVLFNKQVPAVSVDHIRASGLFVFIDHTTPSLPFHREGINVYDEEDNFVCEFDEVTWGHGASGMLFANGYPISKHPVSSSKLEEIRLARLKAEEANLHHTTAAT